MKRPFAIGLLISVCLITCNCSRHEQRDSAAPFKIIATDSGFEAPEAVPIGLRHIIFENHGSEIHEAMLVKLPRKMNANDYWAAVKAGSLFPQGALDYSGAGLMSPGATAEMWLRLDPGDYVLICWNDGHAERTPVRAFSVRYPVVEDTPPREDVVLRLYDYRFEIQGKLHKGTQTIRVETPGPAMHEADIYRLHPGKSAADLKQWRKADGHGAAPADALGGALDNHDISRVVWLRKNFTPGRYVFYCEMPVTANSQTPNGGITHDDLGMVQEFEIEP